MGKIEQNNTSDVSGQLEKFLNQLKHRLDFGLIAKRRRKRAQYQIEQTGIMDYLHNGDRILDIGCGKGYIGGEIRSQSGLSVFGIDPIDRPTKKMLNIISYKFSWADARNLPFTDNSFNKAMIFFVMHHLDLEIQEDLLREAMRVIKNENGLIFVAEDTVPDDNKNQMKITTKADKKFNPDFGLNKPHSFRSKEEWKKIFTGLGLRLIREVDYYTGSVPHTFFVLSV